MAAGGEFQDGIENEATRKLELEVGANFKEPHEATQQPGQGKEHAEKRGGFCKALKTFEEGWRLHGCLRGRPAGRL